MADIHLIGNAHLDPVWLWRWTEGFSEIISTFRSALDRMQEFPDFKFTSACASYYQWVEKIDPDMFSEIQERVKEGRWNIVGGWFLQPDCNIPDGESFARHSLLAQRYFYEKFGITAKTGYNVDSFGHNAALPQILKKSGMDNYVFMRPMPQEGYIQDWLFHWESDDGSSVLTYRVPFCYNCDLASMEIFSQVKEQAEKDNRDYMVFYGVGNHGGGPTIQLLDQIKQLNIDGKVFSTPDEYFAQVDKTGLPTIHDELQHHARGCYSACSQVKRQNRQCEKNLIVAETLCVMAKELTGAEYPKKRFRKAWKNLLFNQFHDVLGGCSIQKAYEDAGYLFGETMSITEQAITFAMQKITRRIDTLQGEQLPTYKAPQTSHIWSHEVLGTPVVIFNPLNWPIKIPVQINAVATKMTDPDNHEIPFQIVRGDQTNGDDKYHTAFIAEIPPVGYSVYRLFCEKESTETFENNLKITEHSIENNKIRVEFDTSAGDICSFYDKEEDKLIINKPCRAVLSDETDCDTWAHNKRDLGPTVGMFDRPVFSVLSQGPIQASLQVKTFYNQSTLQRTYTLTPDSKEVRVGVKADFFEKHKVLKFTFPTNGEDVIAKIPYGTITRPQNTGEEPCGSWFAAGGICVANDSKYAYDTENQELRLTVLRGAIFADHYGNRDEYCEYMEQGRHECTYSVSPYTDKACAERTAGVLNYEPRIMFDSFHTGTLPEKMGCLECAAENIIVSAIKEAEDGNGNILRMYEMNGSNTAVSLKLFGKEMQAELAHHEIKTLDDTGRELNLIEWEA